MCCDWLGSMVCCDWLGGRVCCDWLDGIWCVVIGWVVCRRVVPFRVQRSFSINSLSFLRNLSQVPIL